MEVTVNTLISTGSSRWWILPPASFSSPLAISTRAAGDLGDASIILSVGIGTLLQGTPIPGGKFKLRHGLVVEKETTRDGYVMRCGALDEEAFGLTEDEAYFDFLTSLRDRYDSLGRRDTSLSARDVDILGRLRSLLEPKQA
jgi:hypothetical protein